MANKKVKMQDVGRVLTSIEVQKTKQQVLANMTRSSLNKITVHHVFKYNNAHQEANLILTKSMEQDVQELVRKWHEESRVFEASLSKKTAGLMKQFSEENKDA